MKTGAHVLAFLGGILILLVGSLALGASLLAAIAMVVASAVWERRGRKLSPLGHWLAAVCGAAIVFVLFASVVTSLVPNGTWKQARQAADSAQKASAKTPPPAWLERISPGVTARHSAATPPSERMQAFNLAVGAAFALLLFVVFFGSLAWAGGMLVGYGVNGHWPGTVVSAPALDSAAASSGLA